LRRAGRAAAAEIFGQRRRKSATTNLSHVTEVGENRLGHTGNKRSVLAE